MSQQCAATVAMANIANIGLGSCAKASRVFSVPFAIDDADLLVTVAADMVRRYGENAPARLGDQAGIAHGLGDQLSMQAWGASRRLPKRCSRAR